MNLGKTVQYITMCYYEFSFVWVYANVKLIWNIFIAIICQGGIQGMKNKSVISRSFAVYLLGSVRLFCDPTDCSPPGSSVHGIFQTIIPEWVAIPFCRGSSWPRDGTHVSCLTGFFTAEPLYISSKSLCHYALGNWSPMRSSFFLLPFPKIFPPPHLPIPHPWPNSEMWNTILEVRGHLY